MTISNIAEFVASLPDWAALTGCFSGHVAPSDIDGVVERRGRCLFLEHKRPGVAIREGQLRLFRCLAGRGDTVIVIWSARADLADTSRMLVLPTPGRVVPATLGDVRRVATAWYAEADNGGP